MRSYREYCPIARASEIVAERWTPLVIRNLLYGCRTFSDIARGVPAMSRSLLIKRLKELQRAGVVAKTADGSYELTEAGADLAGVIESLRLGRSLAGGDDRTLRPWVRAVVMDAILRRSGQAAGQSCPGRVRVSGRATHQPAVLAPRRRRVGRAVLLTSRR